tara:strand:+ start:58 stop:237 length:180 start_codon:yes stop_codon:yes gene_type:complete
MEIIFTWEKCILIEDNIPNPENIVKTHATCKKYKNESELLKQIDDTQDMLARIKTNNES